MRITIDSQLVLLPSTARQAAAARIQLAAECLLQYSVHRAPQVRLLNSYCIVGRTGSDYVGYEK